MSGYWPIITFVTGTFFTIINLTFLIRNGYNPLWLRNLLLIRARRKCVSLFWTDIPTVNSNNCTPCSLGSEHGPNAGPVLAHESALKCWSNTVGEVFSSASFNEVPFPRSLHDPDRYICVDEKTLLAFIFSVIPDTTGELSSNEAPGSVFDGSVVEFAEEGGNLIAHVKGTHRRYLTFDDCDGLVHGYPPWYRRTIKLNYPGRNLTLEHPCFRNSRNCARAGWVIAVALTDIAPIPAYLDRSTVVEGGGRGKVLRAGCTRALVVLERLRGLQIRASNLVAAIAEVCNLLDNGPSMGTYVPMPRGEAMCAEIWHDLVRVAIQIFDTKPADNLSTDAMDALGTKADLIVYWASFGVYKVLKYWKQPGREIVLDKRLTPGRKVYLEDCRRPIR
ncbi:hypothetical protein ACJZ2D_016942 [Fusarium nematophilum]